MPKSPVRGILFDKDGTLFDFQATWAKVIESVLDTLAPDRETWSRMARSGGYDPVRGCFLPGSPVVAGSTGEIAQLWAGFRPDLGAAKIERILDESEVITAMTEPPESTRAYFRGRCLSRWPDSVVAANWDSIILDVGSDPLRRIPMMEPLKGTRAHVERLFNECATPAELVARLGA